MVPSHYQPSSIVTNNSAVASSASFGSVRAFASHAETCLIQSVKLNAETGGSYNNTINYSGINVGLRNKNDNAIGLSINETNTSSGNISSIVNGGFINITRTNSIINYTTDIKILHCGINHDKGCEGTPSNE
eukprot:14694960-Ditylum_brightwellii.AAC.1